jgi:hypothetical protein
MQESSAANILDKRHRRLPRAKTALRGREHCMEGLILSKGRTPDLPAPSIHSNSVQSFLPLFYWAQKLKLPLPLWKQS